MFKSHGIPQKIFENWPGQTCCRATLSYALWLERDVTTDLSPDESEECGAAMPLYRHHRCV